MRYALTHCAAAVLHSTPVKLALRAYAIRPNTLRCGGTALRFSNALPAQRSSDATPTPWHSGMGVSHTPSTTAARRRDAHTMPLPCYVGTVRRGNAHIAGVCDTP